MRPNTLIDSIRWAPQRSIAEDIQWAVAGAAFASMACTLLGAALALALLS